MKAIPPIRVLLSGFVAVTILATGPLRSECPLPVNIVETDEYSLALEPAEGAVGDVVGVSLTLRSNLENRGWIAMMDNVCHDPEVAELVGAPVYTSELLSLLGPQGAQFWEVDESAGGSLDPVGNGFILYIDFRPEDYDARFPSDVPLDIGTIYYRLKGAPGDLGDISFCDCALEFGSSRDNYNFIHSYNFDNPQGWDFRSTRNTDSLLRVLEGEATQTERPPEPPEAKVYDELPSPEEVNFRVRVQGAVATPGSERVPVEVYVTADVEYTGIVIPIDFDERYLRLAHAEDHFITGVTLIDNRDDQPGAGAGEGHAVIFSGLGINSYRFAAEGEELHAATLFFDVLEAAAAIEQTTLTVEPVVDARGIEYRPWIGVHHIDGSNLEDPVVRTEVEPVTIVNGIFRLRAGDATFIRGDANADGNRDISDAIFLLQHLFLGGTPPDCDKSADHNDDGALDISDGIYLLSALFLGGSAVSNPASTCGNDPTPDVLACPYFPPCE